MITKFRRLLIQIGKTLPFVLCGVVFISCLEMAFAVATNDYLLYDNIVILNTPISFFIGRYFEYDLLVCVISLITSIAIEACKWNLWTTFYLFVHLAEKSYFDFELDIWQIYVISILNLIISAYFTYKGITIFLKNAK